MNSVKKQYYRRDCKFEVLTKFSGEGGGGGIYEF